MLHMKYLCTSCVHVPGWACTVRAKREREREREKILIQNVVARLSMLILKRKLMKQ